ncbi:permease [Planotetraspora phitsanulokensis]|uniref:Membrane protein n=1 Tax=Planotetraspora phitsanulokensis TaxID=575192 RepID=A0A8J3XJV4_9ACTN|nr:permease [Planotetraspora phitsanulokensis]GII42456.1 membrane protein [Planotetraspora phitsanulokensis]
MDWLWHALALAGAMGWEILWALILGFVLSAVVQAVVRRQAVTALLGDDSPRALAAATGLGMASSSCSYAAVALARSLFRKGASFTAAMTFEIASTNLVLELGILLALLLGWRFTLAEFVGGPIMIVLIAVLYRIVLRRRLVADALRQSGKGLAGSMEGHAAMDMSVTGTGSFLRRLTSTRGLTAISHIFVMEWAAIWRDIVTGLLITGALAAWVPMEFWKGFFLTGDPFLAALWGPVVGPLVAVVSFVCSIGNVPLAAVLWNGGISFGGVVAFIFADLIILPILNIYRKYYGLRMAAFVAGTFFLTMAAAGYLVELIFWALGLTPRERAARVVEAHVAWNYTTWLNLCFLVVAAVLVVRFVRTGGVPMLRKMGGRPVDAGEPPGA